MKPTFKILITLAFLTSGSAFAQTIYSSPEEKGTEPISIKKSEAITEAAEVSGTCGYNRAYISSADLQALLSVDGAVGIRIYNAMESSEQKNCDIVAVAVDAEGNEIGAEKNYLLAKSYDENTSCAASTVSRDHAQRSVETVAESKLKYQKVFFSKAVLEERLNVNKATGITIIPGSINGVSTMMIMAATLADGKISELESNYLKSQLPCPTDCGDSGNYLVSPN